jgi:sugar/nucleoside kinase (ribokinase family)
MALRLHLSGQNPSHLLVIGPIAFDSAITPTQQGDLMLGGSGTYAALAGSYFTTCRIIGVVGDDFDKSYLDRFINRGVDVSGIQWAEGKTFFWKGRYYEDFNKRETLQIDLNVFENFEPTISEEFSTSPYVFLGNIDPELQLKSLDNLRGSPFIVADTIDLWIRKKRDELIEVLKRVNILVINDTEACILAQEGSIVLAGHRLREMGAPTVIIKKGEHGALLFHKDGFFSMPSYPVINLKDPTGAGDSFAGALIGYLAAVNKTDFFNLKHAMVYATAVASLTVEGMGCDNIESAGGQAIQERYEALINMMTF